ncbi:hypothetical protein [Luedemannella helvata]|uniref:ABC transporter permease n=1 Tax=Luedemannella helvata TaxID=349315 RepID=A0ABP4XDC7_9ACTN
MNATITSVAPATGDLVTPHGSAGGSTMALARVEAGRLLRHPLTVIALFLLTVYWAYPLVTGADSVHFAVLQNADRATQFPCAFLLGGAAMIVSNLAVLRSRRFGTDAVLDVATLTRSHRTAAHLLALVPLAVLATALVVAQIVAVAAQPAAVGRINPAELAVGPLCVILLGCLGVLLGRLVPLPVVAPLALVAFAVVTLIPAIPGIASGSGPQWQWLFPVAYEDHNDNPLPADLLSRPVASHNFYLLALILLAAAVSLLAGRGSAQAGTAAVRRVTAIVAAVVLLGVSTAVQIARPSAAVLDARTRAAQSPAAGQVCRNTQPWTYCAYPDFTGRIPHWDRLVRAVVGQVAPVTSVRPLTVRQHVRADQGPKPITEVMPAAPVAGWLSDAAAAGYPPEDVTVGTAWSAEAEFAFAASVARAVIIGGPPPSRIDPACGARGVVILWLAVQASPRSARGLAQLESSSSAGVAFFTGGYGSGLVFDVRQLEAVRNLARIPAADVGARMRQSLAALTAPGATTEDAAQLLGAGQLTAPSIDSVDRC